MATTRQTLTKKIRERSKSTVTLALDALEDVPGLSGRLRSAWSSVTVLGRVVAVVGVLAWLAGWWLGWLELMIVAASCLLLLLAGVAFVVGRSSLRIELALDPPRVTAGDPSAGQVVIRNQSQRRSPQVDVEVPVGAGLAAFEVAPLAPGASTEELFVVSTDRRGVIAVGPATSVRGDPVGLFQRKASASKEIELLVHPRTAPLDPFGTGLLRDLEGLTSRDLSASDLAFHALREYVPGDDRRHIHWKSSAKTGQLLVRQYLDTRRSTLCVVVDGDAAAYSELDEFEVALEIAGSVALRGCRDGMPVVLAAGNQAASGSAPHLHLDALARAELMKRARDLPTQVARATAQEGEISVALVVAGSARSAEVMDRAATRFGPDVRVIGVRVVPGATPRVTVRARGVVLELGATTDLAGLLRLEVAA